VARRWAILTVATLALAGCGGDDDEPSAMPEATEAAAGAECLGADSSIMTPLANKLLVEDGRVRSGFLVESESAGVYYFSAEVDGAGLEDEGDVGTWVTESRYGEDPLYAVNEIAMEHSDWSDAASANLESDSEAEAASRSCVTGS